MAVAVTLKELRDKLGIETNARNYTDCPFCGGKKKLHFSDEKEMWNCFNCKSSGRALTFYARYQLGMDSLPSDKEERSKLSKQLQEFMGYTDDSAVNRPAPKRPTGPKRPVAKDSQLHAVYTAMASLAIFTLSSEHKKELKKRGLTTRQIERNGYRTFPAKTQIPAHIVDLYNSVDPALKDGFSRKKAEQIQLGLYVAKQLEERGHKLDGIPGFYKFGEHWCLIYCPGILIPTRNISGQIVVWQVRRKFEPKYLTLSCSEYPGAVDDNISRCHFPLSNDPLANEIRVIFTEGPLKADVSKALTNDPCAFVAIPGINNTKDLLRNCKAIRKAGVTELHNALDMDRLTNPNVREGSAKLCTEIQKRGLKVVPMYWGEQYATEQLTIYRWIAKSRRVAVPSSPPRLSVYDKLNLVADALYKAGINPGKQSENSQYWEPSTKGIDDYLFSNIQRKKHTQTARKDLIRSYHETLLRINSDAAL